MAINSPNLIAQASKDILPRSNSSNRVTRIVPGQISDFEKDMEHALENDLHIRVNQEKFLPPVESGSRLKAYRARRMERKNRKLLERDEKGNIIWQVELIKEKNPLKDEKSGKVVYARFLDYGSVRKQPFPLKDETTGRVYVPLWLGTPEERKKLATRESVFPELFVGPEIMRPGEEFGLLDHWTLFHDSMVGGKSTGKVEILSNSTKRKEDKNDPNSPEKKTMGDPKATGVFRVIESWTRQDQDALNEKTPSRITEYFAKLKVRSNITLRLFKLLDDAHFLGVTMLRFSGERIAPMLKVTEDELRNDDLHDISFLTRLGQATRMENMQINMGETACMSGKSTEAISLREFDGFSLICREIEGISSGNTDDRTDYPDDTFIIAKAKLQNPEHEEFLTGKTKLYQVTFREREPVLEFEYFSKAFIEVPVLKSQVAKYDDVWCKVDIPFDNVRRITTKQLLPEQELQTFHQIRTLCAFGFRPQQNGPFQFELRSFNIVQLEDFMSNERVLERLGWDQK